MALGHRSLNRRSVENRRCKSCGRGMAMVNNPNGGRYCRWCGFDPTDEHVFILGHDFIDDTYNAECSCGWESQEAHPEPGGAMANWENHT